MCDSEFRFTARTCIEILDKLTTQQLDTEYGHLVALEGGPTSKPKLRSSSIPQAVKREALLKRLSTSLCSEVDQIVKNYKSFVEGVSENPVQPVAAALFPEPPLVLCKPVRLVNVSFEDIQYATLLSSLKFDRQHLGGRQTAYYGKLPYSYGNTTHTPEPYPELDMFTAISTGLQTEVEGFSLEGYSCLATLYKDGGVGIPPHSDNEAVIEDSSDIITISFGVERTVLFRNSVGPIADERLELKHGSAHAMSKESQMMWKHSIAPDRTVTEGRISLTFRKMRPAAEKSSPAADPSSSSQQDDRPSPPSSRRVLLLTDSIIQATPEHIFEAARDHVCIKKSNYYLSDIDGFAPEFDHTDVVIVSCGINDLTKRRVGARALADAACGKFRGYVTRYPGTKIIFNSVLMVRGDKRTNNEVELFNSLMFQFAQDTRNFYFFDSDSILYRSNMRGDEVFARNDSIHISFQARKLVTGKLVDALGHLAGCPGARFRRCEWLRGVTTRSPRFG